MPGFSLQLSDEQLQLRDWVHGFAADVIRPAAAEWDEREETPWPVIQEAAKIGLYGFDFLANAYGDETGLSLCLASEELFWGDGGIAMAIMGTSLAVAAIFNSGTSEQFFEWVPLCFGDAADPKVAAFCSTEADAGSDVAAMRTRAAAWLTSSMSIVRPPAWICGKRILTSSAICPASSRGAAEPGAALGIDMLGWSYSCHRQTPS